MLKVGLTGGIGSGKSTVSGQFEALGIPVIDTDVIARELVDSDTDLLQTIAATFGADVITRDGQLDRKKLAAKVFSNATEREKLEQLLHPKIRQQVQAALQRLAASSPSPYCIIVVPLLLETDFRKLVDRVLLVTSDSHKRIERIRRRDGRSLDEIQAIIDSQMPDTQRRKLADDIIENDSNINDLNDSVRQLHRHYLALAADRH